MQKIRPFLKWPGAKFRIINRLLAVLPRRSRFFYVFMGAGSVSLNWPDPCHANDANPDLMLVWQCLQQFGSEFISECRDLFCPDNDCAAKFIELRSEFNSLATGRRRAALFIF